MTRERARGSVTRERSRGSVTRERSRRSISAGLAAAGLAVAGCSPPASRCPEVPRADAAGPSGATAALAGARAVQGAESPRSPQGALPELSITLTPAPARAALDVEVVARGDAQALTRWSIAQADKGSFRLIGVRDDAGVISAAIAETATKGVTISLPRPPAGAVRVSYAIASSARAPTAAIAAEVEPDRMQASGEAVLALPDAWEDRAVSARIRIVKVELGANGAAGIGAASSFGAGDDRTVTARGRDLRRSSFVAGPMGRALFEAPEGHDEAAWVGYTAFDPRPIAADVAAFRTAVGELFREPSGALETLLIVADARAPGTFIATRRASSVLVRTGVGEPWSGPVRISVAVEVLHAWIGARLWIGPDAPGREAEAYWFTEGLTRHLARDLLFRFGLITPAEVLDEVHGLAALQATSRVRAEDNATLARHPRDAGVVPLLVARGALYAARIEALLRKKSGGKRGLAEVLAALYAKARERRAALPESAWIEAVSAELGAGEAEAFAQLVGRGAPIALPEGALGPCFRGGAHRYEAFDPGFDVEATRGSATREIVGLRRDGPAARAGVREGDVLVSDELGRGRPDVAVAVVVERGGGGGRAGEPRTIRYRPAGAAVTAQGWVRNKEVGDDACAK